MYFRWTTLLLLAIGRASPIMYSPIISGAEVVDPPYVNDAPTSTPRLASIAPSETCKEPLIEVEKVKLAEAVCVSPSRVAGEPTKHCSQPPTATLE